MLGLFGSLNIASRSLDAQQEAMSVTGNNLANVNNAAYSREQLNTQPTDSLQTYFGYEGTGLVATSIQQFRSSSLDNQIQAEGSVTGSLNAQQQALQNAEAQLGEQITSSGATSAASSPNGIAAAVSDFFSKISALASTTTGNSDYSAQAAVVASAQTLVSRLNQAGTGLASLRTSLNTSITNDVASANNDLQTIAGLNQQIVVAQAEGSTPNSLIDQRQQTLEDLSQKISVNASTAASGAMNVSIGGASFVSGSTALQLQTYDAGGGQLLITAPNSTTPLTLTGGSIEGNITTRDTTLSQLQSSLDNFTSNFKFSFNQIYWPGFGANGSTQNDLFIGTTASTISVNSAEASDPSLFHTSGTGASGDNTVALQLSQLAGQSITGLQGQTLSQYYASSVDSFATALASVNSQINTSSSITTMLTNQRDSVGGVNVDDETTNLVQYQKAYQASAELITTLNQMLETLISMKTV
jgi:flagellar hook-associated protein 1 FlgK